MRINPVFKNELKLSTRTMKIGWLIFLYNGIVAVISLLVFYRMVSSARYTGSIDYRNMLDLYITMAYIEFGMLLVIMPSLTAGSITGEKERQTFDMLLTTKMTPWQIVTGKLQIALSTALLLSVSSVPIVSLVFVYGGLHLIDLVFFILILVISAVFIGSIGILYSAFLKRTATATIVTYITLIGIFVGTFALLQGIYSLQGINRINYVEYVSPDIGGLIYILLVNPAVSFIGLISTQAGNKQAILNLCNAFGEYQNEGIIRFWVIISMVIQFALSLGLLSFAAKKINPLKKYPGVKH